MSESTNGIFDAKIKRHNDIVMSYDVPQALYYLRKITNDNTARTKAHEEGKRHRHRPYNVLYH